MKLHKKGVVFVFSILFISMAAGFFSSTLFGNERQHYEIRPEITLPEYKTDMDRVIDVYERVMDDYVKLMENHLTDISSEIAQISRKLNTMEQEMSELSNQLETVQRKLGIETLKNTPPVSSGSEGTDSQNQQPTM